MKRRQASQPSEITLSEDQDHDAGDPPPHQTTPAKQRLSSSFLRAKQQQQQSVSPRRSVHLDTSQVSGRRRSPSPRVTETSDAPDNIVVDTSPPLVMTSSTIETLNTMTTQQIKDSSEGKGFVISFGDEAPVKPKPVLKPRQQSLNKTDAPQIVLKEVRKETSVSGVKSRECDDVKVMMCLVCNLRERISEADNVCHLCSNMLNKMKNSPGDDRGHYSILYSTIIRLILLFSACNDGCVFDDDDVDSWCCVCWRQVAETVGVLKRGSEEDNQRQKDWVEMMSEKRRQQAEENRMRREEEAARRREEEETKAEKSSSLCQCSPRSG